MATRVGFRHCDPRYPFMWHAARQPAARWHAEGDGPANYFADTPLGAWAEFVRHEGIVDEADLGGVRRSLWAVGLPDDGYVAPQLPEAELFGDERSYAACQAEARRLRAAGAERLEAHGAALLPGAGAGWTAHTGVLAPAPRHDGRVWIVYGAQPFVGWLAVDAGRPPADVLPRVRHL